MKIILHRIIKKNTKKEAWIQAQELRLEMKKQNSWFNFYKIIHRWYKNIGGKEGDKEKKETQPRMWREYSESEIYKFKITKLN